MSAPRVSRRDAVLSRLRAAGAGPKRSLGQNFLISDTVIDKILAAARAEPFSEIVEVGPGLGALTEDLIEIARASQKRMTMIELDRSFAEEWRVRADDPATDTQSGVSRGASLRLVEGDALKIDWRELALQPGALFVSNLPYQISSSIVIERCLEPAGITRMILMFQKEVAQRIGARASTEAYGLLTVIAQTFWETATVSDAGPKDFFPPPNVASRVLVFKRRSGAPAAHEADQFLKFAKAGFAQRRKLLAKNLGAVGLSSDAIAAGFAKHGLKSTARAEELTPVQFLDLFRSMSQGSERT